MCISGSAGNIECLNKTVVWPQSYLNIQTFPYFYIHLNLIKWCLCYFCSQMFIYRSGAAKRTEPEFFTICFNRITTDKQFHWIALLIARVAWIPSQRISKLKKHYVRYKHSMHYKVTNSMFGCYDYSQTPYPSSCNTSASWKPTS